MAECDYNPPAPAPNQFPSNSISSIGGGDVSIEFRYIPLTNWMTVATQSIGIDISMELPLNSFALTLSHFSAEYGGSQYGSIPWMGHLGTRPGSVRDSYHNVGKAFDLAWVHWEGGAISRPYHSAEEASNVTAHRRLLGVEAALRKSFGYVLNRHISDHHNHFHVDNWCPLALRLRRRRDIPPDHESAAYTSSAYFVQDCIDAFTDVSIDIDGDWGPQSKAGFKVLISELGMECLDPVRNINEYMLLLDYVMMHGFSDELAGAYRWGDNVLR